MSHGDSKAMTYSSLESGSKLLVIEADFVLLMDPEGSTASYLLL